MAITFEAPNQEVYQHVLRVKNDGKLVGAIYRTRSGYFFYVPLSMKVDHNNRDFQMFATLEACKTDVAGE